MDGIVQSTMWRKLNDELFALSLSGWSTIYGTSWIKAKPKLKSIFENEKSNIDTHTLIEAIRLHWNWTKTAPNVPYAKLIRSFVLGKKRLSSFELNIFMSEHKILWRPTLKGGSITISLWSWNTSDFFSVVWFCLRGFSYLLNAAEGNSVNALWQHHISVAMAHFVGHANDAM